MQNAWELQHTESVSPTFGPSMNDGRTSAHADNINSHNQLGIDSPETRNQRLSFGELLERSISAPPSNDNRDGFGGLIRGGIGLESNQLLFGIKEPSDRSSQNQTSNYLQEESQDSYVSRSLHGNPHSSYSSIAHESKLNPRSDISSLTSNVPKTTYNFQAMSNALDENITSDAGRSSPFAEHRVGFNLDFSHNDKSEIDYNIHLQRPKSAAPQISRPPPGIESAVSPSSIYDYGNDRQAFIQGGIKRPASTGVIGDNSNVSNASSSILGILGMIDQNDSNSGVVPGRNNFTSNNVGLTATNLGGSAIRPAAKTLMELIQEDFPKTSSPRLFPDANLEQIRPRTASPPRSSNHGNDPVLTRRHDDRPYHQTHNDQKHGQLRDTYGNKVYQNEEGSDVGGFPRETNMNDTPQYVSIPISQLQHHNNLASTGQIPHTMGNQPVYTTNTTHLQHVQTQVHHRPPVYEVPSVYYSARQQHQDISPNSPPEQLLHHHSTMFVNTNTPYYTVQYTGHPPHIHPGPHPLQNPQMHSPHAPHQHEYISIVPVHHHPHVTTVATNGNYAYWHGGQTNHTTSIVSDGSGIVQRAPSSGSLNQPIGSSQPASLTSLNNNAVSPLAGPRHQQRGKNVVKTVGEKMKNKKNNRRGGGRDLSPSKHSRGSAGNSPILEEFRNSKNRSWTVQDILGHVVEFCQDQNGSRFIQQRLEVADSAEKHMVMSEVLPSVRILRNDVFGNYVVQKLLEHGDAEIKALLRDTLIGEMLPLSLQMYGCRVIQKSLEALSDDDAIPLLAEFHGNVITCIHDQNGNHVMQKCIEVMSNKAKKGGSNGSVYSKQIDFIIDDVMTNVEALSCHPYGCRVLQRMLEHCVDHQRTRVLDKVSSSHRMLLDDQYGNYVIQHVLQFGRNSDRDSILGIVVENGLLTMSRQKFASNVVEKLLKYGSASQRNAIVREMLKPPQENDSENGNSSVVLLMVRDAYANYVVQTTLDVVPEGAERRDLLEELNKNAAQLRNYTFAKHIVAKLTTF